MNTLIKTELLTRSSSLTKQRECSDGWFTGFINAFNQSRFAQVLTTLLAVQLVLSVVLGVHSSRQVQFATGEPILSASADIISKIEIIDSDQSVQLVKQDDQWYIEGETKLPAQISKVNTVLDTITTVKTGLPVASSEAAQEQLKVSEDSFLRRLSLSGDELETTTMLLGTSPGLRKSHLRREDSREIYSASLPVSDLPSNVNDWLDKNLLSFSEITSIESNGISYGLVNEGNDKSWTISSPIEEGKKIDSAKIENLVNTLQGLRVSGFANTQTPASADDETTDTIELNVVSDKPKTTLAIEKSGDTITIKRGDVAGVFTLTASQFEQLSALRSVDNFILDNDNAEPTDADDKAGPVNQTSG